MRGADRGGQDLLFDSLTFAAYGRFLVRAAQALGLGQLGIAPHALRHTGPSVDALSGMSFADIKERGFWASDLSVRRYKKAAMLLRQLNRLSAPQQRDARQALLTLPVQLRAALRQLRW